ncbi:MAG: hypothetical protein OEV89_07895 [Desulfobulbaceae bacterium]|nr:hypothetical protein [Desulfobulbaceae bacterium]HIJ90674.1 hypothetical protein [Deltaproteobacteria bacterium]
MDELLQEIKMLPGVLGVFASVDKPDILFSYVPAGYDHETLKLMGVSLQRIFKMNASCQFSVNSVEMRFSEAMVLGKFICDGSLLVILCEAEANFSLINMTSNMLLGELALGVEKVRANPDAALQATSAKKAGSMDFAQAQNEEPLKSAIPVLQDALARAIGPIAAMLVKEIVGKWLQGGLCAQERFSELVDLFCQEIGDATLENEFRAETEKILPR